MQLKIKRAKIKKSVSRLPKTRILAKDMIYSKMITYDTKAKEILQFMIDHYKKAEKAQFDKIKQLYQQMRACDDIVIDCAHKLAPYQSPKLESVEVKSKIEHRYVMQVPQQMKSKDDWMKHVGAEKLTEQEIKREKPAEREISPSIHDYDIEEDELDTYKRTMN